MNHLRSDKKGMELSINFFVILIITLVVFGFGIKILMDIFNLGQDTLERIDSQTEDQIKRSLVGGDRTSVPINEKEIKRGKNYVFGVGVSNKLGSAKKFKVTVTSSLGISKSGAVISTFNTRESGKWTLDESSDQLIQNNDFYIFNLNFRVPEGATPGKYVFNVRVKYGDESASSGAINQDYDVLHKIIVVVPS